jgi:hypothetical protein
LILLDLENNQRRFIPDPETSRIIPAISLAGTRVMNRMRVEGTALVRHAEVACWVMSPEVRALTEVAR